MRRFEFDLQLPDGRIVTIGADADVWREAFSRACATVEQAVSLAPNSGIVCRAYRARRSDGTACRLDLAA